MTKLIITVVLAAVIYFAGKSVFDQYKVKQQKEKIAAAGGPTPPADGLQGLPAQFESSLQAAQAQGAPALKTWLDRYRPYTRDPKLAAIELDYVVLVSRSNPAEAK